MQEQDPKARVRNFHEVALGYNLEDAVNESDRCLACKKPLCIPGCPISINIPGFICKIQEKDFRGAYDILSEASISPAICGRVCRQEDQCELNCTVGKKLEPVAIGHLERWIGDMAIEKGWSNSPFSTSGIKPNAFKIGIIGSGPGGLACAADMAKAGCDVTVYEALHLPGGVLRYGIPEFRLPDKIIEAEISQLKRLGVKIHCDTLVGRLFTIEQMLSDLGFNAVFIGVGAGYPKFIGIPGESLNGVLSANEFLTRCNLMKAGEFPDADTPLRLGRKVAVIGAGNTAMDAMRVALRLGAEKVYCIYRRSRAESPARSEELRHAEEESVCFSWLTNPVEILGDESGVRAIRCTKMELGEPDDSGRRRPVSIRGSEYELEADMVIYAIGTNANPIIGQTSSIKLNQFGYIEIDEKTFQTSIPGVFAGGDIVTGAATVILAMGAGRKAAVGMQTYLGIL